MNTIIEEINNAAKDHIYLEAHIKLLSPFDLGVYYSDDLLTYSLFSIRFGLARALHCATTWHLGDTNPVIIDITNDLVGIQIFKSWSDLSSCKIYKLSDEDNLGMYVAAQEIKFQNEVVKFYSE